MAGLHPGPFLRERSPRNGCAASALESENSVPIVLTTVSFPLTPALSLGERETRIPAFGTKRRWGLAEDWRTILPLPRGEGRGEGEGRVRVPRGHTCKERSIVRELQGRGEGDLFIWTEFVRRTSIVQQYQCGRRQVDPHFLTDAETVLT